LKILEICHRERREHKESGEIVNNIVIPAKAGTIINHQFLGSQVFCVDALMGECGF
jgi:hypothetical protein